MKNKIQNLRFSSVIGPIKANWIFSLCAFKGCRQFCSGMLSLRFLPESLHGVQLQNFLWMASVSFGHQICFTASIILLALKAFLQHCPADSNW